MFKKMILTAAIFISGANALTLPDTLYKSVRITPESSYEIFKLMAQAKELYQKGQKNDASELFIKVLQKATKSKRNKNIDQYDYLYANSALLNMLLDNKNFDEYKRLAKRVISFLDRSTNRGKDIWEEGELGKFQLQVYRDVANNLALLLYKESNRSDEKLLKEALKYANISQKYIRDDSQNYIKKTKLYIQNALKGNPPLKEESDKIEIIKVIKSKKTDINNTFEQNHNLDYLEKK
jgi:hypothetical protein